MGVGCRCENDPSNIFRSDVLDDGPGDLYARNDARMGEIDGVTGGISVDVEGECGAVECLGEFYAALFQEFAAKGGQFGFGGLGRASWQVEESSYGPRVLRTRTSWPFCCQIA